MYSNNSECGCKKSTAKSLLKHAGKWAGKDAETVMGEVCGMSKSKGRKKPSVIPLICPVCNDRLRPSLGYGTGYWLCNCALGIGIPTPLEKQEWVKKIESIFKGDV